MHLLYLPTIYYRLGVRGGGIPLHADRSALLSRLLTVPCMLDACSLFSASCEALDTTNKTKPAPLSTALAGMVSLKPSLHSEFPEMAVSIAENLQEVVDACVSAAPEARKDPEMLNNLVDGVSYAKDACLSLASLLQSYQPAAVLFLKNPSCQQLIEALGAVHDQLLPIIENIAFSGIGRGKEPSIVHSNLARRCIQVEVASEIAVAALLTNAYLDASIEDITGGSSSSSSSAGPSGSSTSFKPDSAAAIQRGEALLHAFTLLGHREGAAGSSSGSNGGNNIGGGGLSLGPALAQRHGIGGSIQKAVNTGIIALDEAQTDYIAALLDVSSLASAPVLVLGKDSTTPSTSSVVPIHTNTVGITQRTGMDVDSSTSDDSAVLLSLVSQVKDLLPEFGDGYIATCLDTLGRNPEKVINALLEGNIPRDVVESVDSQLTFEKYEKMKKENVINEAAFPVLPGALSTNSTSIQQQEQQRKRNNDSLTAKYLDAKETTYAEKIKAAAIQSQWEYEDEYDDSYDELLHIGADGVAEGEGGEEEGEETAATGAATAALRGLSLGGRGGGRGGSGGGRGTRGKGGKMWISDGRIYHYPKPGAKEVASEADAQAVIQQAAQASKEIHGLGPGGNKPGIMRPSSTTISSSSSGAQTQGQQDGGAVKAPTEQQEQQSSGGGGGRRGGRSGGGGGRGGNHKYKDKNKAAIGNHHRKDRAAQKMSRAAGI
jgi:activating signal cointegrator complex subunit 2